MSEGIRPRRLPTPGPMSDDGANLDARIRRKMDAGEPLDDAERAFLADLPATREIPPAEVQRAAREAADDETSE